MNPIKRFKAEWAGFEFKYISERKKDYKEAMENVCGVKYHHLTQKWIKVH